MSKVGKVQNKLGLILEKASASAQRASSDTERMHIVAKAYASNKELASALVKECGIYDKHMKLSRAYQS